MSEDPVLQHNTFAQKPPFVVSIPILEFTIIVRMTLDQTESDFLFTLYLIWTYYEIRLKKNLVFILIL